MPSYQTTGIVIGRTNFGEADRIIRVITFDHGKLSAVARGVRRIKSRLGGHLEPFGEVQLSLATGRGNLDVITSAQLQWYPYQLSTNYGNLETAFDRAVMLDRLLEPGQPQPQAYRALSQYLHFINDHGPSPTIELWYMLQIAATLGYRPELTGCVLCGQHAPDRPYHFDAVRGGILCDSCAEPGQPDMSIPAIKLWRLMCDYPFQAITQTAGASELAEQTLPLAKAFFEYHIRH